MVENVENAIETVQCKLCGGVCKPSKALLNQLVEYHHDSSGIISARDGNAQMIDCLKCELCGHSFVSKKIRNTH